MILAISPKILFVNVFFNEDGETLAPWNRSLNNRFKCDKKIPEGCSSKMVRSCVLSSSSCSFTRAEEIFSGMAPPPADGLQSAIPSMAPAIARQAAAGCRKLDLINTKSRFWVDMFFLAIVLKWCSFDSINFSFVWGTGYGTKPIIAEAHIRWMIFRSTPIESICADA